MTLFSILLMASALGAGEDAVIGEAQAIDGCLVHAVQSKFQRGTTEIRVLLPEARVPGEQFRVVYVLPVEAGRESRYGDGMAEVRMSDLANQQRVIFVAPTFSHLPWYADSADDPEIRQETYFLKVVVPFVERTYAAKAEASGRLLLGFSKSGWGAWSLLLRHPDLFGKAAAWDAPLAMEELGKYGTRPIFGTPENFGQYRVADLLRAKAAEVKEGKRLILTGYGNFRAEHERTHALLDELKIDHKYRDGPLRKHDWHSGWVAEAVELLVQP